jgi:hypothetical protein
VHVAALFHAQTLDLALRCNLYTVTRFGTVPSRDGFRAASNHEVCHDCFVVHLLFMLSRVSARLPVWNQEVDSISRAAGSQPPRGFIQESK